MNTHVEQTAKDRNVFILLFVLLSFLFVFCIRVSPVYAVPETTAVRVTDVTTSSFSLVWMTDVAANPGVEVYSDSAMQQRVTDGIAVTPMPAGSGKVAEAARASGIMKVQVSGVKPATTYYARTVTADPSNATSISYSALQEVTTASTVALYRIDNGSPSAIANDLAAFPAYIRPSDAAQEPGLGDLILVEEPGAPYPVSAFVGDGVLSPEGLLDLNNIYGTGGANLAVSGNEKMSVKVYRAGTLATLTHYRIAPQNSGQVSIAAFAKGFFADINLDGGVDDQDFALFKAQYKTVRDDGTYNPDYDFVDDPDGKVDVREFSTFATEYGRTNVQ
jgi:hypothetical protein